MNPAIADLVSSARALTPSHYTTVHLHPDGTVSVMLTPHTDEQTIELAAEMGCPEPEWRSDGKARWLRAENRDEEVSVTVYGPHHPVAAGETVTP